MKTPIISMQLANQPMLGLLTVMAGRCRACGPDAVIHGCFFALISLVVFSQTLNAETSVEEKAPSRPALIVTVTNLENNKGTVRVAIYDAEKTWLKKPLDAKIVTPKERSATAIFTGLEPGTYAVSTYHDVNNSGELDTNFLGIPTERYGFSNDASGTFGPPDFEDAAFAYKGGKETITIKVD